MVTTTRSRVSEGIDGKDAVGLYLEGIAKTPLLSAEEEVELAKTIELGLYAKHILNGDVPLAERGKKAKRPTTDELEQLVADGATDVLLVGEAEGVAVLRLRPSLWTRADECYLAELYVIPGRRAGGLGRALLRGCLERAVARGCDFIDLATSEDDVAARHLYESEGFRRTEGDGGPLTFHYELEL